MPSRGRLADTGQVKNKFFILIYSHCWHRAPCIHPENSAQMSFSRCSLFPHYLRSVAMEEFKLFNYLMTGPKKCEDCARPGVPALHTFYLRAEAKHHIAAPARHTHALGINCIFISAISESDAKCSIYHMFCLCLRLSALSPGPSEYQFIIDHSPASCCCSLCAVLTLKYHSLRDPVCGRNK